MVKPKRREDPGQTIRWLYLRLTTGLSWQLLTDKINLTEPDWKLIPNENNLTELDWESLIRIPYRTEPGKKYQWSDVSKRVRELMSLLGIEPSPIVKEHTARYKQSPIWQERNLN